MGVKAKSALDMKPEEQKGFNDECFFNGTLIREMTGHQDPYYFCKCKQGYLGDNCHITKSIFNESQKQLVKIIHRLDTEFVNHDKHQQRILLKGMHQITKFKLSLSVTVKLISLLKQTLKINKEMDNLEDLYQVYDSLFLALFDQLEEQKKQSDPNDKFDVDFVKHRQHIYDNIMDLIKELEYSFEDLQYAESFLSKSQDKFVSLNTFSFTMTEYQIKDLTPQSTFELKNPIIDTAQQITSSAFVHYTFVNGFKNQLSPYNTQLLVFSNVLFENTFADNSDISVSNLIYIKNINPEKPHERVRNYDVQIQKIVIRFPLLFLPPPDQLMSQLQCKAYNFNAKSPNKYGSLIHLNQENEEALCEFNGDFDLNGYYFGVFYSK